MKPKPTSEKITLVVNAQCQMPVPKDFLSAFGVGIGDEYAWWKTPRGIVVVFFKKKPKKRRKIPRHAFRGRIGRWNNRKEFIVQAPARKNEIMVSLPVGDDKIS